MFYLALLGVVAVVVLRWVRATKRARVEWLRAVNLIGRWERQAEDGNGQARSLTFTGDLAAGGYAAKDGETVEKGDWLLRGHTLTLSPAEGDSTEFDLRLFQPGKIGLDGPGREREIYVRSSDNVIPLRLRR